MRHDYSADQPRTPTLHLDAQDTRRLHDLVDDDCDNQSYPPGGVALTMLEWLRPIVAAESGIALARSPLLSSDVARTLHIVLEEYARAVRASGAGRVALQEWCDSLPETHASRTEMLREIETATEAVRRLETR